MSELIVNGGFETGSFDSWLYDNTTVTPSFKYAGNYAAHLLTGVSVIYQIIPGNFSQNTNFSVFAGKIGVCPNPAAAIIITFFDENYEYLGEGLVKQIEKDSLRDVISEGWEELTGTVSIAPEGTALAIVTFSKQSEEDESDIVFDEVSLTVS